MGFCSASETFLAWRAKGLGQFLNTAPTLDELSNVKLKPQYDQKSATDQVSLVATRPGGGGWLGASGRLCRHASRVAASARTSGSESAAASAERGATAVSKKWACAKGCSLLGGSLSFALN